METNSRSTATADVLIHSSPICFECKKAMADDQWFCRLTQKAKETADPPATRILLCSPTCALRHFAAKSEPTVSTEAMPTIP